MDIKGLTNNLVGTTTAEGNVIKPSVASSDHAPNSQNPVQPQALKTLQAMIQGLQLGKVFDVIVTRIEGSMVTLAVPGSPADAPVLQAEMKSPPPIGTRLTLQLTDDVSKPELKVIATPNSPQDAVSRNLRTSLQQQQAMTPLLANLALLAKSANKASAGLPDEVLETARQLVQQFPHSVQIKDSQGLKQAMQQTGPYLESTLAKQHLPAGIKATDLAQGQGQVMNPASGKTAAPTTPNNEQSKQARLEVATQTIQLMTKAMQQQPIPDVRANLLRLAAVIRAVAELGTLQKAAAKVNKQVGNTPPQSARPASTPLPESLLNSKPLIAADSSSPALISKPALITTTQATPQTQSMIRSQTPQPQAAAQASLANILNTESALDELLGQVEGALARIHVQQLQTAATDQQNRPVWVMELPVRTEQGIDLFDIRIQRDTEDHAEGDPKAPWTVTLAFDLEKLGAIRAQVTLYGEDRISTVFWAEQQETSTYFNQHMDRLESRLKQAGLEVARLDCHCGKPDSPPPSQEPRLVDEKV